CRLALQRATQLNIDTRNGIGPDELHLSRPGPLTMAIGHTQRRKREVDGCGQRCGLGDALENVTVVVRPVAGTQSALHRYATTRARIEREIDSVPALRHRSIITRWLEDVDIGTGDGVWIQIIERTDDITSSTGEPWIGRCSHREGR